MIDDDYLIGEGDTMPEPYWRLPEAITVEIRIRTSRIAAAPLVAFANEFYRASDVFGPPYLSLWRFTCHNAYLAESSPNRTRFDTLVSAHPDTFTTVIGASGPIHVWLALRLTRLNDTIADTLIEVCTATRP